MRSAAQKRAEAKYEASASRGTVWTHLRVSPETARRFRASGWAMAAALPLAALAEYPDFAAFERAGCLHSTDAIGIPASTEAGAAWLLYRIRNLDDDAGLAARKAYGRGVVRCWRKSREQSEDDKSD